MSEQAGSGETGSWWGWYSILAEAVELQQQWRENPLPACPVDGEPLTMGPNGLLFCKYDGWDETKRRRTD